MDFQPYLIYEDIRVLGSISKASRGVCVCGGVCVCVLNLVCLICCCGWSFSIKYWFSNGIFHLFKEILYR